MVKSLEKDLVFKVFLLEDRKMVSSKVKAIFIVFALFLVIGIITAGCKKEVKHAWVNTSSMPGSTFSSHGVNVGNKQENSTVVYLGSDKNSSNVQFGPKDVSFDFRDLK